MTWRHGMVAGLILAAFVAGTTFAPSAPPEAKMPPWELAKARAEAARKAYESIEQEYLEGKATQEQVRDWSNRWMRAQQDISNKKPDQLAAIEAHVTRMRQLEKAALGRFQSRRGNASEVSAAEYFRVDAELSLSKARTSK